MTVGNSGSVGRGKSFKMEEKIKQQLDDEGYDYAVAIATVAEIEAGAACGQLSIIEEE